MNSCRSCTLCSAVVFVADADFVEGIAPKVAVDGKLCSAESARLHGCRGRRTGGGSGEVEVRCLARCGRGSCGVGMEAEFGKRALSFENGD